MILLSRVTLILNNTTRATHSCLIVGDNIFIAEMMKEYPKNSGVTLVCLSLQEADKK